MVAITCNVGNHFLEKTVFQEIDIAGIVNADYKTQLYCKRCTKLADTIRKAFYIAKKEDRARFLSISRRM